MSWNDEEKTWNYPCRGSRLRWTGDVVNDPALGDSAEEAASRYEVT